MENSRSSNSIPSSGKNSSYPLFTDPEYYLQCRDGPLIFGHLKRWLERRALDRCLAGIKDIYTICDSPCGPGRLFPYWRRKNYQVIGVELSKPMVEAARNNMVKHCLAGTIQKGDAFYLKEYLSEIPDLAASIRFIYYFAPAERVELLRSLAAVTRKYILVQYKTTETYKGRRNFKSALAKKNPTSKKFCSYQNIIDEVAAAGLICRRIEPIGESSDRVFVLAEIPDGRQPVRQAPIINRPAIYRHLARTAAAVILGGIFWQAYGENIMPRPENMFQNVARKYQDGNDYFYVVTNPSLKNLSTNDWYNVIGDINQVDDIVHLDQQRQGDSFLIIASQDLSKLRNTPAWSHLVHLDSLKVKGMQFLVYSTEKQE